jgi:DNA polymerase-3 subunit gamma/tau
VKFLLATTDPQKLPVTVLSRCLQFSLKRLSPEQIGAQLQRILDAEKIAYDAGSLALLARGADGSMRDGLSLLDQAIAFGGGRLNEPDVRAMLGTIEQNTIDRVLQALINQDAPQLLALVAEAAEHNADMSALLEELMLALHGIALAQADATLARGADPAQVQAWAQALAPEDVQLYYQIALQGRRDLASAPDARTGLEMTLLRMLVFRPGETAASPVKAAPTTASVPPAPKPKAVAAPSVPAAAPPAQPAPASAASDWNGIIAQLKVGGLVRELASNSVLVSCDANHFELVLNEANAQLLNREREAELKKALEAVRGGAVKLTIRTGQPGSETPTQQRTRENQERQQAAVAAIDNDPVVSAFKDQFNARVNPNSIRPKTTH